jgi:hypothetical protein
MIFKFLFAFLCFCTVSVRAEERRRQPNVIFVLADDLGIGDLEPTNPDCRIKTPHLETMELRFSTRILPSRFVRQRDMECSPDVTTGGPAWRVAC